MRLGRESELEIRDDTVVADRKTEREKTRQCKGKKRVGKEAQERRCSQGVRNWGVQHHKIKWKIRPKILWRGYGRMGPTSVSVYIVITENFGGNCFSKVVGEKDRSLMLINCRGIE